MSSRKAKDMKRKSKLALSARKQEVDLKLRRPFLTGLMLAVGFGLGSALLGLLTIATPIIYMYVQGLMAQ